MGVDAAVKWLLIQKDTEEELEKVNDLSATHFDYCLRIAAGLIQNPVSHTMQEHFFRGGEGERGRERRRVSDEEEFFVAHLPRADELDWQNDDCVSVMAGSDRIKDGLPGHVLIVPRNGGNHWKFSNIRWSDLSIDHYFAPLVIISHFVVLCSGRRSLLTQRDMMSNAVRSVIYAKNNIKKFIGHRLPLPQ